MGSTSGLRASDAERDDVVDQLRTAMVEGRLSTAEFDERVGMALSARTVGELVPVTADLPPGPSRPIASLPTPVSVRATTRARDRLPAVLGSAFTGWFAIFWVCCLVWLLTSGIHHHSGGFWPAWVLVWGLFSVRGGRGGRGRAKDRPQIQRGEQHHHHRR